MVAAHLGSSLSLHLACLRYICGEGASAEFRTQKQEGRRGRGTQWCFASLLGWKTKRKRDTFALLREI
jgi:hypothetical protein